MHRRTLLSALPILAASSAWAQKATSWPARPLRIIVPFGAGSTTDLLGRMVAQHLGAALGQPAVALAPAAISARKPPCAPLPTGIRC